MDWWKWRSRGRSGKFMIIPCSLPLRSILLPVLCPSSRLSPACTLWHWVGFSQWKPPARDWKTEERGQGIYTSSLWFCSSEAVGLKKWAAYQQHLHHLGLVRNAGSHSNFKILGDIAIRIFFFFLAAADLSCGPQDLLVVSFELKLQHVRSNSLTRDGTWACCIGITES